jgi:Domain of unknown function (DUF4281)
MPLELIYNTANIFVLPFWVLMIALPKWGVTRKVMASYIPFVILALTYLYLFVSGLDPETAEGFTSAQLSDIARLFAKESVAATGWVHFLVMDLFVGRWIYLEGQRTGVWTIHSLALCLFAGPLGLLSHITTSWVSQRFFGKTAEATPGDTSPDSAVS